MSKFIDESKLIPWKSTTDNGPYRSNRSPGQRVVGRTGERFPKPIAVPHGKYEYWIDVVGNVVPLVVTSSRANSKDDAYAYDLKGKKLRSGWLPWDFHNQYHARVAHSKEEWESMRDDVIKERRELAAREAESFKDVGRGHLNELINANQEAMSRAIEAMLESKGKKRSAE